MKTDPLAMVDAEFDRLAESNHTFWEFDERDRLLWAMACLRHHAGANGFRAIAEYDELSGFAVSAYAVYALRTLKMDTLSQAAEREWGRIVQVAAREGIDIPSLDPRLERAQLTEIQSLLQPTDKDGIAVVDPSDDNHAFLSVGDTDFAERVLTWLSEEQGRTITEDNKTEMATPSKPSV